MPSLYVRILNVKVHTFDFLEDTSEVSHFSLLFKDHFLGKKYKCVHASGTLTYSGWTQIMLSQLSDLKLLLL